MLKNRLSEAPTQAGSPATMHSVKRFFKPACQLVMALGISLSMALAGSKLVESSHLRWSHLSWMMGALLLLAIAYRVINAYGWTLVLNAMGADVRGGEATRVWLVSESRRWLPGSIWSYVSRASMAASIGIPIGLSAASMMVELLLVVAASALAVLPGLIYSGATVWQYLSEIDARWAIAGIAALGAVCTIFLFGGHRKLTKKLHNFQSKLAHLRDIKIQPKKLILPALFFVATNVFNGWITFLTIGSVSPEANVPILAVLAVSSAAWLFGFCAIFSPGGLVVREASFAAMLLPWLPYSESLTVAVIARLMQFVAEAIIVLWILIEKSATNRKVVVDPVNLP